MLLSCFLGLRGFPVDEDIDTRLEIACMLLEFTGKVPTYADREGRMRYLRTGGLMPIQEFTDGTIQISKKFWEAWQGHSASVIGSTQEIPDLPFPSDRGIKAGG